MNDYKFKKFVYAIAYCSVIIVAIALLLSFVFKNGTGVVSQFANILSSVAQALAYIVVSIAGFFFVRTKRNPWFTVIYIVAVIILVAFFIIPFFS